MPAFENEGLNLVYHDEGTGPPVVLVHGFASNAATNWIGTGWVADLVRGGYRCLVPDLRGHGESDKPHASEAYEPRRMAADVIALLDQADVPSAAWIGYSMGARIGAFAALERPERISALVLGGLGEGLVTGLDDGEGIAEAMLADSIDDVATDRGRMFRAFADKTGADRAALAACIETSRERMSADDVASIEVPTLVAVGTEDDLAGPPEALAALLPNGRAFAIPRRDHMLAVGDRQHKRAVLEFLEATIGAGRGA